MKHLEFDNQPLKKLMDQKEQILGLLRQQGYRITKQRQLIIDIILDAECSCCKEIYYQAHHKDSSIGIATVYRMVKTLEEIGAIDRRNLYRISCGEEEQRQAGCTIVLKNKEQIRLSDKEWLGVLESGLRCKGLLSREQVDAVFLD